MSTDIKLDESLPAVRDDGAYDLTRTDGLAALRNAQTVVSFMADKCKGDKFISNIQGKQYPLVTWWTTVGAALGLFPVEVSSVKLDRDGETVYEGTVEVRRGDQVVSRASAICSSRERRWNKADEYAVKSMATTRATGKAYRIAFSFLAVMAGLEPTPAEEIPHETEGDGGEGTAAPSEPAPDGSTSNPYECPECHKFAVIKGAPQYGGGWVCWKKKGGCGQKWDDLAWAAASSKGPSAEMQEAVLAADAEPIDVTPEKPAHTTPKWPGPATAWDAARVAATPKWPDPAKPKQSVADPKAQREAAAKFNAMQPSAGDEAEARRLFKEA